MGAACGSKEAIKKGAIDSPSRSVIEAPKNDPPPVVKVTQNEPVSEAIPAQPATEPPAEEAVELPVPAKGEEEEKEALTDTLTAEDHAAFVANLTQEERDSPDGEGSSLEEPPAPKSPESRAAELRKLFSEEDQKKALDGMTPQERIGTLACLTEQERHALGAAGLSRRRSADAAEVPQEVNTANLGSLTPEEGMKCRAVFKSIDRDGSGTLDINELAVSIKGVLESAETSSIDDVLSQIDGDGNQDVDVEEWIEYMANKKDEMGDAMFVVFLGIMETSARDSRNLHSHTKGETFNDDRARK